MIVCPILEDEMVYNLLMDKDEKNLYLIENDNTKMLLPKLERNSLKYAMISEEDFIARKVQFPREKYNVVMWLRSMGLHSDPKKLKEAILADVCNVDGYVDGIMLYYGLCGQALLGICDWARENIKTPLTIFKDKYGKICDDCISVPVGGPDEYLRLLKKYPGVMYLTPAVACSQDEFMEKNELFQGLESVDMTRTEFMKFMLDSAGYKHALKIQTGLGNQEHFQAECENFVRKYGLELIYLDDEWISKDVVDRTYAEAKSFLSDKKC